MIASIYYSILAAVGIVMIPLLVSEVKLSFRRHVKINPIVQETCWLCHRVLGEEVYLYKLARSTHRIICASCAKLKAYQKNVNRQEYPARSNECQS